MKTTSIVLRVACDHPFYTVTPAASDDVTFLPSRGDPLFVGTILTLTCTVNVDRSLVDTDINITLSFTSITNSMRINTTVSRLNDSTFRGVAQFSFLLPSDDRTTYQCLSSFLPSQETPFVMRVSNPPSNQYIPTIQGTTEWILNILLTNACFCLALPPPVITLPPSPVTMAGQSLSFTCTASVIEYLAVDPVLEWVSSNSNPLTTMDTTNSGVEFNSTLIFNNLRTSQGDQYNCSATINVPGISSVQSVQPLDVVVQSK